MIKATEVLKAALRIRFIGLSEYSAKHLKNYIWELEDIIKNLIVAMERRNAIRKKTLTITHKDSSSVTSHWDIVEQLAWGRGYHKSTDYKKLGEQLDEVMNVYEIQKFAKWVQEKREVLSKKLIEYKADAWGIGDDGFWDLTAHIVGLGKKKYEETIENPREAEQIVNAQSYVENFQYIFNHCGEPSKEDQTLVTKCNRLEMKLVSADTVMLAIDTMISSGDLSSRSRIGAARLAYGEPNKYVWNKNLTKLERG